LFACVKLCPAAALAAVIASVAATDADAGDLVQAYELARRSDPQLAGAASNLLASRESYPQARAVLLPQMSGTASLTRSYSGNTSFGTSPDPDEPGGTVFGESKSSSTNTNRSIGISLTQSIYDHANWTRLRAVRARNSQADFEYEAAAESLMVRTADAYFNVLTAIQSLASARAQTVAVKRQLDQAEHRLKAGMSSITDVHEARAAYDSARAGAIQAQTELDDAGEALAEITGQPLAQLKGLRADYVPTLPTPADENAWVEQALRFNPGIRAAERAALASEHDIATARAGHYPSLSATASYNRSTTKGEQTSNGVDFPANSQNDGATIALQLEVPIFSGGAVRSRVRQAIYGRDAIRQQLEQQRRAVRRQTRSAYRAVVAGISEIEARGAALVSARSAYDASEAGLEVGTRTIVEVLITQQNLFAAQREYASARHTFLVNTLRLKQAAGSISPEDIRAVNAMLTADAAPGASAAVTDEMDADAEAEASMPTPIAPQAPARPAATLHPRGPRPARPRSASARRDVHRRDVHP